MKHLLFALFTFSFLFTYGQLDELDRVISKHEKKGFNGNLMYVKNDSIQYLRNCGTLDFEKNVPINDSSLFELGENSMQFTAVAIIQLIEAGKIQYTTTVKEIFPLFPYQDLTIEHLLRLQSGLPRLKQIIPKKSGEHKIFNNQDVLNALITKSPAQRFQAGEKFDFFSSINYIFLALIVEQVSGKSFPTYLKENIFDVAGMNHSRIIQSSNDPHEIPNNTAGYNFRKKKKESDNYKRQSKIPCVLFRWING